MSSKSGVAGGWDDAKAGAGAEPGVLGRGLGPVEMFMRKLAEDPHRRAVTTAVWVLDRAPEWDRLVYAWDRLSRLVPRFRQRIVDLPLGFPPVWVVDPDFDLGYHLRRVRVPEPGSLRQVLDLAGPMMMGALDPARPLWETTVVEGLEGGRAAVIQKGDHTMGDGQGGMRIMEILYDTSRDADPGLMPPAPDPEEVAPAAVLRTVVAERLRGVSRSGPQTVGRLVGSAGSVLLRPRRSVSQVVGLAASAGRVFRSAATPPSPLLRHRSLSYHFDVLELRVDDLRRAGKAAGGTVTDAFLAAVTGGLRIYHQRLGAPVERLPLAMPISIRREGDPLASNRLSAVFLAPQVGVPDARARMERIHAEVRRACSEPALSAVNQLLPAVRLLPPAVFRAAMRAATFDVGVSALVGPDRDLYTAGAKVLRMYGFGQLIGGAMMVGLVSMGDTCCVTINCDPAAVTEPDLFVACLREGFEEVLQLGGQHQGVTMPAAESTPGS